MAMRFPDRLRVIVLDQEQRKPVENVAIVLELFAVRKNNYTIGPRISDEEGRVEFTREFCESSIAQDKKAFVGLRCDSSERKAFKPCCEITRKIHPFGGGFQHSEQLFAGLEKVKNADYRPASLRVSEKETLNSKEIELHLSKTRAFQGAR